MNAALLASKRMDWGTPESVLSSVRKVSDRGVIGFDPCSNEASLALVQPHSYTFTDGLTTPWGGRGLVYVNPPYGRALGAWSEKIVSEAENGTEIIALVPSRTDTKWFHRMWKARTRVCLWKGRITFEGAPSPAPFPSAVFYFGPRDAEFLHAFIPHGVCV